MRDTKDMPEARRNKNTLLVQQFTLQLEVCTVTNAIYQSSTFIIMQLVNHKRQEQVQKKVSKSPTLTTEEERQS